MRKKICIALMAAFTVLLGVSGYFIIDHYREAEHQEQMYDSLVQLVEDSETEPAEPIIYSEDTGIVQKVENGRVYTVEGNSGDSVRQNSYPVGYYEILGYGAPAY